MLPAMRYTKSEVQNRIARDYVMGSLSSAARRRCDALRLELLDLDQKIRKWSEQFQPLADMVPGLPPGPKVWDRIHTSINSATISSQPIENKLGLWDPLSFVRTFVLAAAFLVVALLLEQLTQVAPISFDYISVMTGDDGQPQFVAMASQEIKQLEIQSLRDALGSESDYQLWALSKTDGQARSLGLVDSGALSKRQLSEADWRLIIDAQELLVTAEIPGGSQSGEPSDDVVSRGLCIRLGTG